MLFTKGSYLIKQGCVLCCLTTFALPGQLSICCFMACRLMISPKVNRIKFEQWERNFWKNLLDKIIFLYFGMSLKGLKVNHKEFWWIWRLSSTEGTSLRWIWWNLMEWYEYKSSGRFNSSLLWYFDSNGFHLFCREYLKVF